MRRVLIRLLLGRRMLSISLRDVISLPALLVSPFTARHVQGKTQERSKADRSAQNLVIGTTLCGDWAGLPSILAETCPALVGDKTWYVPRLSLLRLLELNMTDEKLHYLRDRRRGSNIRQRLFRIELHQRLLHFLQLFFCRRK